MAAIAEGFMHPKNILQTAIGWTTRGIAVIPIAPRSKRPIVNWRRYQDTLPTPVELTNWFRPGRRLNAAAICGWAGLTVLDFDDYDGYARWLTWAVVTGGAARRAALETYRVRTGRGVHAYLFVDETPGCGKWCWGDLKATGGYVLIPPSVHPSGAVYAPVDGAAPIVRVGELAEVMPDPPEPPAPLVPLTNIFPGSSLWPKTLPEEIRERIPILELLPDAEPSGGQGRWYMTRCPLHDDRSPSMRVDTQAGVANCFAGCTDKALDVIGLYARLNGLSNGEAIKTLAGRL